MSRADRFDRADFDVRYSEPAPAPATAAQGTAPIVTSRAGASPAASVAPRVQTPSSKTPRTARRVIWPIAPDKLKRVGESVLDRRKGKDQPHKGVDLFAEAGTEVLTARGGHVIRVVDGRRSKKEGLRRAGLFVDVRGADALVYRYLHLAAAYVAPGATIKQGTVIGLVAAAHTSGLSDDPHLHFEVRQGDYDRTKKDYGTPVDPLRLLPPRQA